MKSYSELNKKWQFLIRENRLHIKNTETYCASQPEPVRLLFAVSYHLISEARPNGIATGIQWASQPAADAFFPAFL